MRLSVVLIVKDEEAALPACLESVRDLADEIVVVDSGSKDATIAIARQYHARVLERPFEGFGRQKQFAIDQARGAWVLSIDADERVTPRLAEEIRRITSSPDADRPPAGTPGGRSGPNGYEIRREVWFLGHRLRFGGMQRDRVLRLFRRGRARVTTSSVHERIELDGPIGRLRGALEHHTHRSVERYLEKANLYSSLAAADGRARGRRFHWWMHLRPAWEMLRRLVLLGGILDGHAGFLYAGLSAYSAWLRAIKLRELEASEQKRRPTRSS